MPGGTPMTGAGTARHGAIAARLKAGAAWRPLEIGFWLLAAAGYFLFPAERALVAEAATMGLFAVSLDLILGYAGIVSLGHAAFFGAGGYVAGLLAQQGWGEPLSGLLVAGAVSGALGLATSPLVLRGSDLTRLMVTLGIAMMIAELANKAAWLTGGTDGLQGVEIWPILGIWSFDLYGRVAYAYSLAVLFLVFLVLRRLVHSPFGLALRGIKENERRMRALGAPVDARLVAAYGVAAAVAGIAGALLTETTQFVSLDVLGFDKSAEALLIVVLGGAGTLYGPLIGALVFMAMYHVLSELTPEYWQFWMGLAFVAIVLFARGGLLGVARLVRQRLRPT